MGCFIPKPFYPLMSFRSTLSQLALEAEIYLGLIKNLSSPFSLKSYFTLKKSAVYEVETERERGGAERGERES